MNEVMLKAYAKINLGLDVTGRRPNGYHDVKMVMQTIALYDEVTVSKLNCGGISIKTNSQEIPIDENNIAYKAVKLVREKFKIKQGVQIYINKNIPVAAGMAGGSADCAAVLKGMNEIFELGLRENELMKMGVRLGADVPYCIMGGTALSEGIGEILTPLPDISECFILVGKPDISVSTKFVYENLKVNELSHPDIDGIVDSINKRNLSGVIERMENVLETVTINEYPVIREIKEKMENVGAAKALMSGSGPTVFGVFREKQTAEKAYNQIVKYSEVKDVFLTMPHNKKRG